MDTVKYINLIQNIDRSHISISEINNLCKMQGIVVKDEEEIETV